jgi:hypothetical protein
MRNLPSYRPQDPVQARGPAHLFQPAHAHRRAHALSRRQFLATAGIGIPAVGATFGLPRMLYARPAAALPNPIPGGIQPFGPGTTVYHVLLPAHPDLGNADPAVADPSVITDFNGHVGLAYVRGRGIRTDLATGATADLPFEVDLRFMKGEYVGVDGARYHGAFALI